MSPTENVEIARLWLAAWAARDHAALVALYADDARHTSPRVRQLHPETGGFLIGREAIATWFGDAIRRLPDLRYTALRFTANDERVFIEYLRSVPGEVDSLVAEVLEIENGRIVASRVFHA